VLPRVTSEVKITIIRRISTVERKLCLWPLRWNRLQLPLSSASMGKPLPTSQRKEKLGNRVGRTKSNKWAMSLAFSLSTVRGTKVQGSFVCRTMTDNECYILGNMSKSEFREFRALIIEMVLHTGDRDSHWSGIL
jgi:hypothetical protein